MTGGNRGSNPIPKVAALVVVSLLVAWLVRWADGQAVVKMDGMPAADFIAYHRHALQHSYIFGFAAFLIAGGFYLGLVEFISFLFRLTLPKTGDS